MNRDVIILREAVAKVVQMLAQVSGLTVTQRGSQAYVQTCPKTLKPKLVNIPFIPDDATPDLIAAIQGFLDHEVAHILFTDWQVVKDANKVSHQLGQMHNIVEDTFIEREMARRFPGCGHNLHVLHDFFVRKITTPALEKIDEEIKAGNIPAKRRDELRFNALLVPLCRAWSGQHTFHDWLLAEGHYENPFIKALIARMPKDVIVKFPKIRTSREALDVAKVIMAIIYPPAPPAPKPQPKPQQQQQQPQEGMDGEPCEDGEAGEGQQTDTKGEGKKPHKNDSKKANGDQDSGDDEDAENEDGEGAGSGGGKEASKNGKKTSKSKEKEENAETTDEGTEDDGDGSASAGENDREGRDGGDASESEDGASEGADGSSEDESEDEGDGDRSGSGSDREDGDREGDDGAAGEAGGGSEDDEGEEGDGDSSGSDGADDGDGDGSGGDDEEGSGTGDREADEDEGDLEGEGGEGDGDGADETSEAGAREGSSGEEGGDEDAADEGQKGRGEEPGSEGGKGDVDVDDAQKEAGSQASASNEPGIGFTGGDFETVEVKPFDFDSMVRQHITDEAIRQTRDADYSVYSTEFDVIGKHELTTAFSDGQFAMMDGEARAMVGVMQKEIERMMAQKTRCFNVGGQKRGKINAPGLYRLVANDPRVFKRKEEHQAKDTAVSLVCDNSGSMAGDRCRIAMSAAYALSSVLERVNIQSEVIGFTTDHSGKKGTGWSWGKVEAEGRKLGITYSRAVPLRLTIFKEFAERLSPPVRHRFADMAYNQPHMGANVDGESVQFALHRLLKRKEQRKVMLVLSDGFPAGGEPAAINSHLHKIVADAVKAKVEIIGVGIQSAAVRSFYPKAMVLNRVEDLPKMVMGELKRILMAA
jgi:cobalamin biosynthesis protein CobT